MKKIKIELTQKEAEELRAVAGNGYGDGDYYGLNDGAGPGGNGYGGKRENNAFIRAYEKLSKALGVVHTTP